MTDPITYPELKRMMLDPDTPDARIAHYLTGVPTHWGAFDPQVRPDPNRVVMDEMAEFEVESAIRWGNAVSRWRRHRRYDGRRLAGDRSPVLVSEGDSWFQFPFLIEDVVDHLGSDHLIWSLDAAGDTAGNMVNNKPEYMAGLNRVRRHGVKAFLFSAAGNDVIGEDLNGNPVLGSLLKKFNPAKNAAWHIDKAALSLVLATLNAAYGKVVATVRSDPDFRSLPILIHGYDYAIPGGQPGDTRDPSWAAQDEWLGRPLTAKGITDPDLQREVVKLLIDALYDMLESVAARSSHVYLVDLRGKIDAGDWADEIHGTTTGFANVAREFRRALRQVGV